MVGEGPATRSPGEPEERWSRRVLLGEFRYSLDAKGRLFVPARWRDELSECVVVTKGLDRCLHLMPRSRFEEVAERVIALPMNRRDNRGFSRIFFSGASEGQIDRQGRVPVPQHLREYAGLDRGVVLTGYYRDAEIWDEATWDEYQNRTQASLEDIAEKLDLLGREER